MAATTAALTATALITLVTTFTSVSKEDFQDDVLPLLIVGFIIAFILAFAVGANDVANSFGTTVGAKTLSLRQACILASIFEALGAILLGAKVGETIRKGIIDPEIYRGNEKLLMVGEVSAMIGSGLWQLIATFLKLPVSGTHSIVGATVGFSLVAMGAEGVNWMKMGLIVASWFISPIMAGAMAAMFYWILRRLIFNKENPVRPGLIAMPILYSFTFAINFFSIFHSGAPLLGFDKVPLWGDFVIALVVAAVTYAVVSVFVVRRVKKAIEVEKDKVVLKPLPEPATNSVGAKKTIVPPALETISEKEPLMEEEEKEPNAIGNGKVPQNGAGDAPVKNTKETTADKPPPSPKKVSRSRHSSGEVKTPRWQFGHRLSSSEEGKAARQRSRQGQRSHSVGDHHVRIPPLLQLEKNVLKSRAPEPTVNEFKNAIRKNFSEPSMIALTEKLGGEFFEVHINRHRRAVTIQRKKRHKSTTDAVSESSISPSHGIRAESGGDADGLQDYALNSRPEQLEEPFDDDDEDEGMGLMMKSSKSEEKLIIASDQKSYTGAIEEGFRKLSTSQYPDIIEIKVAGRQDEDRETGETKNGGLDEEDPEDRIEVRKIFNFLQVLTACFGSFAHGGNDVSNAIGPLIALFIIYSDAAVEQTANTPIWILFYGGIGICAGMWVWGRRVIKTMGEDLTSLTPSRGFTIELMSAVTVLTASNIGIPVSTTHCKVGAVVSVGWVRSREAVDWKIFRNIVLAWFVTVPVSAGLSALMFLLMKTIMGL